MNLGIDSKLFLVTGGSNGIGFATADLLVHENARVIIIAREAENLFKAKQLIESKHGEAKVDFCAIDCQNPLQLQEYASKLEEQAVILDGLVINVGDGRSSSDPISARDQWDQIWRMNFDTAVNSARSFIPLMNPIGASMVFVASIAGVEAIGAPSDYSSSKAALIALAKNLSFKLGSKIRVNTVLPGNVRTSGGTWDIRYKTNAEEVKKILLAKVPQQRLASPEEIAYSIVFLLSACSSFTNGATLRIDGGQTVGFE